jgi:hypothetical protein
MVHFMHLDSTAQLFREISNIIKHHFNIITLRTPVSPNAVFPK